MMSKCWRWVLLCWCMAISSAFQAKQAVAFVQSIAPTRSALPTVGGPSSERSHAIRLDHCTRIAVSKTAPPSRGGAAASAAQTSSGRSREGVRRARITGGRSWSSSSRLHMFDPAAAVLATTDVSAWSVTSVTSDLAADLFQASLLPYLAFLWFLKRPETKAPDGGVFAFAFLLVFVAATIPAGIYAKTEYGAILADVDYLHGIAESFLTLTNLLVVAAFRKAVVEGERKADSDGVETAAIGGGETVLRSGAAASVLALLAAAPVLLAAGHTEPANALSFPTWMVHVSSLIEWLAAMTYVWRYADVSGLPQWKGLTWGMLPLHTSGLMACTYHIFYNSPELSSLVAMQAGMTCFGNSTMAFATWRVWRAGIAKLEKMERDEEVTPVISSASPSSSWSDDLSFCGQILGITVLGAGLVKWGELFLDFPFQPSYTAALTLILAPTAFNAYKWAERSKDPSAPIEGML